MSDKLPVACSLSPAEIREREATLLAQFKAGVIAMHELDDGYAFRLPGEKHWLALLSELVIAERECCPFLSFELTAEPTMEEITLRISGPDGTKDFLRSTFMTRS